MIFIESKIFEKLREKYLEEDSYRQLQNFLMKQPLAGDVIQGTGGLRKLRWSASGKGKRDREKPYTSFDSICQK